MAESLIRSRASFGTAPVFLTAISTILFVNTNEENEIAAVDPEDAGPAGPADAPAA